VIAEIIFESKEGADAVVETFNNQMADGHLLHVYHKIGNTPSAPRLLGTASGSAENTSRSITPLGPRSDIAADRSDSRGGRRNNDNGDIMDGSYGFDDGMDVDDNHDNKGNQGLYSDNLIGRRRNARGGGSNQNRGRSYR